MMWCWWPSSYLMTTSWYTTATWCFVITIFLLQHHVGPLGVEGVWKQEQISSSSSSPLELEDVLENKHKQETSKIDVDATGDVSTSSSVQLEEEQLHDLQQGARSKKRQNKMLGSNNYGLIIIFNSSALFLFSNCF